MLPDSQLTKEGALFGDPESSRRLVVILNYLTVTHLDIAYAVTIVSRFLPYPSVHH